MSMPPTRDPASMPNASNNMNMSNGNSTPNPALSPSGAPGVQNGPGGAANGGPITANANISSPSTSGAVSPNSASKLVANGSSGLRASAPGARESAEEVEATLKNLEAAEALLYTVIEHTESAVEHIESRSLGQRVNTALLGKTGDNLLTTLDELHDRLSREIPNLVKYVPFERSSYGKKKDAAIAQEKLDFARTHLAQTLNFLKEPLPSAAMNSQEPIANGTINGDVSMSDS